MKYVLYNVTGTDTAENIYLPGIAQPDYNDVRFASSDGTPLDYWMETPTSTDHAIFWVKVPSIPEGPESTVAVDIYYGNSTIGSGANGDATFPLFDDFDGSSLNTTRWTSVYTGTPSVSNSILTLPGRTAIQSDIAFNSNASLRFHGNIYGYTHRVGFHNASDSDAYAYAEILTSSRTVHITTGVNSVLNSVSLETDLPDQYKTMEFSWNSTSLSVKNETGTVGSVATPVVATLPVGLRSSSTRTNYYDWVFVRQLADTEPAIYQPETVPVADFSADVTNGDAPLRVRFTDASAGMPMTWAWDFDNDGTVDSTAPNPTHAYSVPGTYTVTLTVTNAAGSTTETKTALITVTTPPPPTAGFSADSVTGSAPFTVAFTDESSGIVTAWAWDFGDGDTTNATHQNPVHTYQSAGTYTVNLTVTNAGGSDQVTKTDYITVEEAGPGPVAAFTANTTSGTAPLTVAFTDASTGTITDWAWDFNNDGVTDATTQDANHTYAAPGTYSVNLTVTGPDGSDTELKTNFITVTVPDADLTVSAGPPSDFSPSPNLFARYTANTVSATVKNSGSQSVGPFNVTFDVDGNVTFVSVAGLGAGNSTVVTTTDIVDRLVDASVPILITADAEGAIAESNETNNEYSYNATVIYNGYAGHRWSAGDDLTTQRILNIQGDVIHSLGDTEYGSDSVSWTASDLPLPAGATVKDARLYVPYTWDWQGNMLGTTTMTFNGGVVPHDVHYREQKNWGAWWEYAFGVFIFNVTDQFNANENNNAVFSHGYAPVRGMNLVVTYEDANATAKQIFINEGFDMLFARSDFYTTPETATAYAPFTGAEIDIDRIQSADLITSVSRLSARGVMLFNGQEWASYWAPGRGEVGINTTDITPYLSANDNTVMFRSSGEELGIEAYLAILKVEYKGEATAPVADFEANVTSGAPPLAVQFNDTSTGFPTSWAWEFGDGATAGQKDPVHTYTAAGTYTVNLTAANTAGNDTEVKTGYITVTGTGPSLPWQDPCESLDEWTHTGCMLSDTVVYEGSHSINGRAAGQTISAERMIAIPAGATELRFNAAATASYLMGSWVKVYLDGEEKGSIPIPTAVDWNRYAIDLSGIEPGEHAFNITVYSGESWAPVNFYLDNLWVIGDEEVLSVVNVTPAEADLAAGETLALSAGASTQYGERLTETTFTWSSSNEAVGTVNGTGFFTALGTGTTTVTAAAGNVNGTAQVTVTGGSPGGDAPVAAFTATPLTGLAPLSVTFTDASTNSPTEWSWESRPSGTDESWAEFSTEQSTTHSFEAGAYDIRLTATNAYGNDTVTKTQYVSSSAGAKRLATVQNGTVSGDLYVGAYGEFSSGTSYTTNAFNQTFNLPAYTGIQWARLYTVVYAAGQDNRTGTATVKFDGNGNGTYETLGIETLATAGDNTVNVYPVNDHVNRQYSDYMLWYDVTDRIDSRNPKAEVVATPVASNFDGRIKELVLVVAYNDGDGDEVHYWVNDGHDWQASGAGGVTSTFATGGLAAGWTDATLRNVMLSSTDARYTFNGADYTGANSTISFGTNTWDVRNNLTAGSDSNFTYVPNGGSYKTTLATLAVKYPASGGDIPNLAASTLSSNNGEVFSASNNTYTATITNIGTGNAGAFDVEFNVSGTTGTVTVSDGLAAGAGTAVTWTDETVREAGDVVTITAIVDPAGLITEANEENNRLSIEKTVVHNGYRGMRWTDGEDLDTAATYDVRGDLLWSAGDGAYLSASTYPNWTDYIVNWTAGDLAVPEGATIAGARLYVPYTWDKGPIFPENVALTFNGEAVPVDAFYEDEKGWGASAYYPYGMVVYNVTDAFNPEGNTALLANTFPGGGNVSVRGMLLAVVYDDGTTAPHTILMNEGFDLLFGGEAQGTTPEQATAYAPFFDVETDDVRSAALITVAPGAGPTRGDLFINDELIENVWSFTGTSQIGVDERDVTALLRTGENLVGFQSSADYMEAAAAFLILEYLAPPGSILVTSDPAGAAVWLDNEDTGEVTPVTLENVPAGDHVVTLKFDGYADASETITVEEGETATVDLVLTTLTGSLTVTSTPEGAAILIDGADTGEVTNATLDGIAVGTHTVTLKKDGYADTTADVTVAYNETAALHLDLVEARGSIAVASTPTGAAIWLDGIDTGMTTNAILENVAAGEHTVTVKKAGYADASATVAVADDEIATVSFTLTAPAGSIVVTSAPDGARIVLDGAETGETTNATLTNVPVGTHTVRVSLDGYLDAEETVTVAAGATASVHFDLDASAITLQPGWNFVSTPKQLADGQDTIAIFDGVDTADRSVLYYNGTNQWEALSREEAFRPLDGIWIYANTSYTIPLVFAAGSISTPPTKDLDEGWNAIGFTDTVPEPAVTTLRSVETTWATLFGWKTNEQAYDVSIIRGATGRHGETRELFPTQGYWLYMNDADTLAAIGA